MARRYLITNVIVSLLDFKREKSSSLKHNKSSEMVRFFSRGALYYIPNYKPKAGSRDFKSFSIKLVIRCFGFWNFWADNHVFFSQLLNVYF